MSLYSSQTKILTFSDTKFEYFNEFLSNHHGEVGVFRVGFDGQLMARDTSGSEHSLNAPAIGSVVLVRGHGDDEDAANACAMLWERAGIAPPAIVSDRDADPTDLPARVLAAIVSALEAELRQTAASAVRLDRQIAILREELEDTRAHLAEARRADRQSLNLPLIAYERVSNGATRRMDEFPLLRQLLPYAARHVCGVAFQVEEPTFADGGALTASLRAREDDSVLASWQVEKVSADGWVVLSVDEALPYKYRYVDLELKWIGTGGPAPEIRLADAFGDPDGYLRTAEEADPHNMLALRIWTGDAFQRAVHDSSANFPTADRFQPQGMLSVPVTRRQLSQVEPVTEHDFDWAWYRQDGDTLFLHPVLAGPSIVRLDLTSDMHVAELVAFGCNKNGNAPPIEFSIIVAGSPLDAAALEAAAGGATSPDTILGSSDWTSVAPGTVAPASVRLKTRSEAPHVYFMVRVTGESIEYAHFWFSNIRMVLN